MGKVLKTNSEWRKELDDETYRVTRAKGTERPFTGQYDKHFDDGIYNCKCCGEPLFESQTKFDSGCGWPSFFKPLDNNNVEEKGDYTHFMIRTEVLCKNCGAHLGHVFTDGPKPTGLRYCINSVSLNFEKKD
jgi:peptide-methionine (R)-S-oxide reductase